MKCNSLISDRNIVKNMQQILILSEVPITDIDIDVIDLFCKL